MDLQVLSKSPAQTEKFAEKIGERLKGGEIIELVSDLGGGKTAFVRGLARGMGSKDRVTSPTFTISNIYTSKNLKLIHFDFYRLKEAGLMEHELSEALKDPGAAVVVEWGALVADVLPTQRLRVVLESTGDEERQLRLSCPARLNYLIEKL